MGILHERTEKNSGASGVFAYAIMAGVLILGLGIWYCRRFFVEPFRAGLRGD